MYHNKNKGFYRWPRWSLNLLWILTNEDVMLSSFIIVLLSKSSDPTFAWFSCFLWNALKKKHLNTSFNKLNFRTGHWYNNNTIWSQTSTKWFENTLTCSDLLFRDLYCSTTCHFFVAKISFWWRTLTAYPRLNAPFIRTYHLPVATEMNTT